MEWETPVWWGKFLLFSRSGGHKTKESYPTRPGSPTPCKQGLGELRDARSFLVLARFARRRKKKEQLLVAQDFKKYG